MIQGMINWILANWMTGWLGLLLYWLPLAVCIIGYTLRTSENYKKDTDQREKLVRYYNLKKEKESRGEEVDRNLFVTYHPTDKIGTLIGRALVSIVPFANAWAAMFDVSPKLFSRLFSFIEKVFDTPLVPEPKP